jgi:hypothetical protein
MAHQATAYGLPETEPNADIVTTLRRIAFRGTSKRLRDRHAGISKRDWNQWVQTIFNNLACTVDRMASADGLCVHDVIRDSMTRSSASLQMGWFFAGRAALPFTPSSDDPSPSTPPEGRGLLIYSPPRSEATSPDAISHGDYNPPASMESKLMKADDAQSASASSSNAGATLSTFMLAIVLGIDGHENASKCTSSYSSEELLNPSLPGGLPGTPCRVLGYTLLQPGEFVTLANLPTGQQGHSLTELSAPT